MVAGGGRNRKWLLMGTVSLLREMKMFWIQTVGMVAPPCDCIQRHWTMHCGIGKWVNCVSCEFSVSSATQSCVTLCDPMDCSTPGLPVHHQLPEFTQTHVHWVGDAIQPSHPLSSPSPPTFNFSPHQSLFQWVNSSHEVAKVLEFSISINPSNEHPGLIFRMDWLDLLAIQELWRVFSNTTCEF